MEQVTRKSRWKAGIVAGAIAGAIAIAMSLFGTFGIAGAQESPSPDDTERRTVFKHRGHGFGMGIHGEFVTPAPNGGYQTIATQAGEVTAVNSSSITVRSEDGYSKTYRVDDNTMVNAGNDGIDDVKVGDTVRVTALVVDGTYQAVRIHDKTQSETLGRRWRPAPPMLDESPDAPATPSLLEDAA